MTLYEDDYHFPHYYSLGDYYQDDDRHIRDFINEDLH